MEEGATAHPHPPPQQEEELSFFLRACSLVNDVVHFPILDQLIWYTFWMTTTLLAALPAFLGLLVMLVYDLFSGKIGRGTMLPPDPSRAILITGR